MVIYPVKQELSVSTLARSSDQKSILDLKADNWADKDIIDIVWHWKVVKRKKNCKKKSIIHWTIRREFGRIHVPGQQGCLIQVGIIHPGQQVGDILASEG